MKYSAPIIMAISAMFVSPVLAVPYPPSRSVPDPHVLAEAELVPQVSTTSVDVKRDAGDVCLLRGVFQKIYVLGSGGAGQAPVYTDNNFFLFQRPGVARFRINGNPLKSGWQTIPSSATGTAQNVDWYSDFDFSGWRTCRSSYDYHETEGTPEPREEGPCTQLGAHCVQCTVVFPC